jgi:hypothetical protein
VRLDRQGLGIDRYDLAAVLDVDEDPPLEIGGGELGLAAELDGAHHLARLRVQDGGVVGAAVEGEDPGGDRVVEDGVGVLARHLNLGDRGEGLEVEEGHRGALAVADEAAAEVVGDGDAVDSREIPHVPHGLAAVGVDHGDFRGVRDVEPPRRGVDGEIVPSPLASELDLLDDAVPGRLLRLLGLFLLLGPGALVLDGQDLAADGVDVDLLDPALAGHRDVEGIDQLAVLLLELLGAHFAMRHLGESGGAGCLQADLGLLGGGTSGREKAARQQQ